MTSTNNASETLTKPVPDQTIEGAIVGASPTLKPLPTSVFHKKRTDTFVVYDVEIQIEDRILGGIPKHPKVIEAWIRTKAGIEDDMEARQLMLKTLRERGADIPEDASYEDMVKASEDIAGSKQAVGFKFDEKGLYIEDRQVKAMLKEGVNILYAGQRFGKITEGVGKGYAGKGPKNFFAERLFVGPGRIHLGVQEPDGMHLMVIHADGPQGKIHSLAYHEYVTQPVLKFQIEALESADKEMKKGGKWGELWVLCEQNGLGASRSQSFGKFVVTKWQKVGTTEKAVGAEKETPESLTEGAN